MAETIQKNFDPMFLPLREERAKSLVYGIVKADEATPAEFSRKDVYLVWFSKTLENWKALVCTGLADNLYYEVTYSGKNNDTNVDIYDKVESIRFPNNV